MKDILYSIILILCLLFSRFHRAFKAFLKEWFLEQYSAINTPNKDTLVLIQSFITHHCETADPTAKDRLLREAQGQAYSTGVQI